MIGGNLAEHIFVKCQKNKKKKLNNEINPFLTTKMVFDKC
jgi:hypothetical protein